VTLTRFECNDTLQAYDTTDITADRSRMVNLAANSATLSRISTQLLWRLGFVTAAIIATNSSVFNDSGRLMTSTMKIARRHCTEQ